MSFYRSIPKLKIVPIKNCGCCEDEVDVNIPGAFAGRVKKVILPRKKMEKNDRLPTPEGKCPDCDEQKDIWIPDSDGSFDCHDFKQHVDRQHKVGKWQCPYCDHKPFGSSSIRLNLSLIHI